jgi:response regulator RpfG family c-di-GMP phosphodiesterase
MTHDEAIAILRRFAGSQFDPRVVDAFVKIAAGFESPGRKGLRALEYALAGKT